MRKRNLLIGIILVIGLLFWHLLTKENSNSYQEKAEQRLTSQKKPVKIAVATDLHYLSSQLTDKGPYFQQMVDNGDGKNMYYIEEITETFVAEMLELQPELLIISGDLTFNGEKESHLDLKEKLARIQKSGIQILLIPGNHDVERSSAASFFGEDYKFVDTLSKSEFADLYQEFGLQQALHKDDSSLSYVYRARKDFWILLVDSNSDIENQISQETLLWIEEQLEEAKKEGARVLSVTHQNILTHHPRFTKGFKIKQAEAILKLYEQYPILANLSGHIHIQHIAENPIPELLTSSLAVSPHQYGFMSYNGQEIQYQAYSLSIEKWAQSKGIKDSNLQQFSDKSRNFMVRVSSSKSLDLVVQPGLSDQEKKLLQDTFGQMNADYFAGIPIDASRYQEGISLWKEQDNSFFNSYLGVLLQESQKDHLSFSKSLD